MSNPSTVFVVDDDDRERAVLCDWIQSRGLCAEPYSSAEKFLESAAEDRPGCLVSDVRMFGMSGVELLEALAHSGRSLPVILLTAFAYTSLTVRAMQAGAITILDKPFDEDELWKAIRTALARDIQRRENVRREQELGRRIARLTEAEQRVMDLMIEGAPNKVIAARLDVSVRTVENRRREVFNKMQAGSLAELVRLAMQADGSVS